MRNPSGPSLHAPLSAALSAVLFAVSAALVAPCAPAQENAAPPEAESAAAPLVSRDVGDPEANPWKEGDWVTTSGAIEAVDERPDDPEAPAGAKALRLVTRYAPRTFGGWNCHPANSAPFPGRTRKVTCWARLGGDVQAGYELRLVDAATNGFSFAVSPKTREWTKFEFVIPEKVKGKDPATGKDAQVPLQQPVRIDCFKQDNWGDRNNPEAVTRIVDVYDLRVHTDMDGIPPDERPFSFAMSFPVVGNCFYFGEDKPEIVLSAGSWIGEPRTVRFGIEVESASGEVRQTAAPDLDVLDSASLRVPLPFQEPGAYTVRLRASGFPGDPIEKTARCAVILHPPALTEEQKKASPYGVNVHGGGYVGYEKFARLGFAWVRDYAYTFGWMNKARGEGAYKGWPWYPKILQAAQDNGLYTLPCLMGAIQKDSNGSPDTPDSPTDEWRRDMARIVATFDGLCCFELDNERDNVKNRAPGAYGAYHRVFAQIMKAVRPDAWAVQEGAAGIDVAATRKFVENGDFRDIDVVNGHRYCGLVGPEVSRANLNTGMGEERKTYQRDLWRHWKKAATADGRDRQLWITEWGWDTRAGQIVSEWEQAAYMQREWVLARGNGVDKLFWYWYYDSNTPDPKNFFDGCGMFDRFREPKPVAAAFAALRTFLPAEAEYLGYANLGPNHMAHVLRRPDGKLVAMAFQIYPPEKATTVEKKARELEIRDPEAEEIRDMFGAALERSRHRRLGVDPVWYVGLSENCEWLQQCPVDLESDFFVRNVSGEPIEVRVANPGKCDYEVRLPKDLVRAGWTSTPVEGGFDVCGPFGAGRGAARFEVAGWPKGSKKHPKTMVVDVDVVPQAYVTSHVEGFDGVFEVDVANQSAAPQSFELRASLPEGWKIEPESQTTGTVPPDEKTTLKFRLAASTPVPATEKKAIPKLLVSNAARPDAAIDYAPVVPRGWTLRRVDPAKISIDADPSDWEGQAAKYQLPAWMLGPRGDKEGSRFFAGWAPEGLYLMFDVTDSKCMTSDPNSFWRAADCIELMFSSPGAAFADGAPWGDGDHQFWFCPLASENRVFSGFWGNNANQKTAPDMQDVESALRVLRDKAGDPVGYRMEIFLPASRIHGWAPKAGDQCGMMFTAAVQGLRDPREIYWPSSKRDNAVKSPWKWAKVLLAD
ncbi:MAG: hypothetical protein IJ678_03615 [Kiritimatiellae bacterium]|nr:hypothetical protein [Kiritimatiellia bacterium]